MNREGSAVSLVYGPDGVPLISPDFIAHLTPDQRVWVQEHLAQNGYTLTAENTVEKL